MAGAPILVVDDAPVNLKLMRLLLTHAGYEVRTAERAEDALQMLVHYRPELILADIQLPGMNGLEMTRQVKRDPRNHTIKVVALTARAMNGDREEALRAGFDDYISKPIDTAKLAGRVGELLAKRPAANAASEPSPSLNVDAMRDQFLDEGCERTREYLARLHADFDSVQAAALFHQWIGSAGLLGYSAIAGLSRTAEELLRRPVEPAALQPVLTDLLDAFTKELDGTLPAGPTYTAAAAGKRIALVGFSREQADVYCGLLSEVKARPCLFEITDEPGSQAIRACDLVLFHVRKETRRSHWLKAGVEIPSEIRLLFVGEQAELAALPQTARDRAVDFLVGRSEKPEILMRIAFAVSRAAATAIAAAPAPAAPVPVRQRTTVNNPRVVLADDDGIVHALVGATLQNHGMSCRSAHDGQEALNMIRSELPHAAVLDVNMPGMDGFQVLAAIRAEKLPVHVILLTSLIQEKDVMRAFDLGADDYLRKPFNPFELVARLKRLMQ